MISKIFPLMWLLCMILGNFDYPTYGGENHSFKITFLQTFFLALNSHCNRTKSQWEYNSLFRSQNKFYIVTRSKVIKTQLSSIFTSLDSKLYRLMHSSTSSRHCTTKGNMDTSIKPLSTNIWVIGCLLGFRT